MWLIKHLKANQSFEYADTHAYCYQKTDFL